jgi:hypothetical protein
MWEHETRDERTTKSNGRKKNMKTEVRWISRIAVVSLAVLVALTVGLPLVHGQADHVRWDFIHLDVTTSPPTISAGGVEFASARNPSTLSIKLTGSGTFVGPASGGTSGAVTGGGTWETFSDSTSTGSGTYVVVGLVNWTFSNLQPPVLTDLIDDGAAANGVAVLRIRYSDGSEGVLGIGCHGPGAPDGTVEGAIASKGHVTYWDAQAPVGGVDANRTVFHVR